MLDKKKDLLKNDVSSLHDCIAQALKTQGKILNIVLLFIIIVCKFV